MKARLIIGVALASLAALPALADAADPAQELRAAIFTAPDGACALPKASKIEAPGGVVAPSSCTANCWDGSSRTCSGTSCSAVDSYCPSQSGYCWSNAEGYKYCPACSTTCYASTTCSNGSQVSCQGTSGDCFSVYQCYAHCDSQYYLCPSTPPSCPL